MTRSASLVWRYDKKTSNITKLHLTRCDVDTRTLVGILPSCISLEQISVWWAGRQSPEGRILDFEIDFGFSALYQVLAKHKETLRTLVIDTLSAGAVFIRGTAGIRSLQTFTKLGRLEIDDAVLYGDTVHSVWDEYDNIDKLSRVVKNFFPPGLKDFTLHSRKAFGLLGMTMHELRAHLPASVEQLDLSFQLFDNWPTGKQQSFLEEGRKGHVLGIYISRYPTYGHEYILCEFERGSSEAFEIDLDRFATAGLIAHAEVEDKEQE